MQQPDIVDTLASLPLFADLRRPQLETIVHIFTQEAFAPGQRILRQGFEGTGFYVIVEGEATVRIDGQDRVTLGKGDFFGEMSILLGETPGADVVAQGTLRALHLGGPELEAFLQEQPIVAVRMLRELARRLRNANRWHS